MKLYHGTDINSALDILNNGLNKDKIFKRQGRYLQLGVGWYTTIEPNIAWFFGTLAADALDACTIIEMEIAEEILNELLANGKAQREVVGNVPFEGEQIWFAPETFDRLNQEAYFAPYRIEFDESEGERKSCHNDTQ